MVEETLLKKKIRKVRSGASSDPLADLFVALKNASRVGKGEVVMPFSSFKEQVAGVLKAEGFLTEARKFKEQGGARLFLALGLARPLTFRRVSKPGQRRYLSWRALRNPPSGVRLISTPKGVMTQVRARREKLGGEVLGEVS